MKLKSDTHQCDAQENVTYTVVPPMKHEKTGRKLLLSLPRIGCGCGEVLKVIHTDLRCDMKEMEMNVLTLV